MRFLLFSLIFLVSSCAGSKKTKNEPVVFNPEATDVIILQRTGCYGTCPIYEVSVFGNGIIAFHGKGHTQLEGKHVGQLDEIAVKELFSDVNMLPWNTYPEEYPIDNVDFPQFFLTYNGGDIEKRVKGNTNAAKELIALTKELDRLVAEIKFTRQ